MARKMARASYGKGLYRGCSWPEVVGLKVQKAKRIISNGSKPELHFQVARENQLLTMSGVTGRVRLIVNRSNRVVRTPNVG